MATSKKAGSPLRLHLHLRAAARARPRALPRPPLRASGAAPYTLPALLMVGSEHVVIDAVEDDNLHFMSEYIDPA